MDKALAEDLSFRIRAALRDGSEPLWLPGFALELANFGWHKLEQDSGITESSYGTARVFRRNPRAIRNYVAFVNVPSATGLKRDAIPIELLPRDLVRRCTGIDVQMLGCQELITAEVPDRIQEALRVLGGVATLLPTICSLVSVLHIIDSPDPEVDVSFSEPSLPFSVFVSVPRAKAPVGSLRLAEALLHEAMHLQLTLLEAVVPLVTPSERTYFSPWRAEYRPARGILHALYVFRIIGDFLDSVSRQYSATEAARHHISDRRVMISHQVREVTGFRKSSDLTSDGAALVGRLLEQSAATNLR